MVIPLSSITKTAYFLRFADNSDDPSDSRSGYIGMETNNIIRAKKIAEEFSREFKKEIEVVKIRSIISESVVARYRIRLITHNK